MADVAVAILNFNGAEHLKKFLPSVLQHSREAQIIVGDNASTDDSLVVLQREFPEVEVIKFDQNYGYAGGYNELIARIKVEFIVLANSDIAVTENWLPPLVEVIKKDQTIAAVQPKILSFSNQNFFEYAGAGGGFMDKYGYPYCRGRIFSVVEEDLGQYDDEKQVFWASGACFLLRKSAFEVVGGFDASFFAHMEEIDLNWRLQNSGYKIIYTGRSKVYHLGGGTLSYDNPQKTYLNFRNSWLMLIKNLSEYNRLGIFTRRYLLDLMSILFFLIQFKAMSAFAVLRAHVYILLKRPKANSEATAKTTKARNNYKIAPEDFSLVWQYFVRNKKKYSDL